MSQHEVKIEELERPVEELSPEEAEDVQGGIGLLLPAVQKVREAAITDGTSNTVLNISGSQKAGDGSV